MTLFPWIRQELTKLSFVTRVEFKNAKMRVYYIKDDKEKYKTLPYRADKFMVQQMLTSIKDELGIKERKLKDFKKHLRPMIAHVPWATAGETDGEKDSSRKDN